MDALGDVMVDGGGMGGVGFVQEDGQMLADGGDLAGDGVLDDFLSDAGAGEGADDLGR